MPTVTEVLPEFTGLAVEYDISKNPFFKPIVIENLRKIKSVTLGETLLRRIGRAQPRSRGTFLPSINVLFKPMGGKYSQAGTIFGGMGLTLPSSHADYNPVMRADDGSISHACPFCIVGGSANAAVDTMAAGNGTGTVCDLLFTNTQIVTSKGEKTLPFIVLAHELIHSYHCLYGVRKETGDDEELKTTGVGRWLGTNNVTENKFREAFGIPLRIDY